MHHGAYFKVAGMAEKQGYDEKLVKIGRLFTDRRKRLGKLYWNREDFIDLRSQEIFDDKKWISPRHLANVELGKNWISIEKFIWLAYALEVDPVELFAELLQAYEEN